MFYKLLNLFAVRGQYGQTGLALGSPALLEKLADQLGFSLVPDLPVFFLLAEIGPRLGIKPDGIGPGQNGRPGKWVALAF